MCRMSRKRIWNSTGIGDLRYLRYVMPSGRRVIVAFVWLLGSACDGRVAMRVVRDAGLRPAVADAELPPATAACPAGQSPRVVESGAPVKLDLLFLVDDSPSMAEEQANLARNFPRLIEVLDTMPGGRPDLHLGVVSSDLGAGNAAFSGPCGSALGQRGLLQVREGCGLDPARGRYLISEAGGKTNFTGDLGDVFGCLARLGTAGCGFEHQLQAVRLALSGFVTDNAGFLRPDAHLAVVFITDEDDCSAPGDTTLYASVVAGQDASLRCSLRGHVCNGAPPPAAVFSTPLDDCAAAADGGGKLIPVQTFVDELRRLRTQSVSVSVIAGWPTDPDAAHYAIGYGGLSAQPDQLGSLPICRSANGSAAVGLRLKQMVDAFGVAGRLISICQDDFSGAMAQIGQLINATVVCQ